MVSSGLRSDQVDQDSLGHLGPVMSVRLGQVGQLGQIRSGEVSLARAGQGSQAG